VTAAVLVALLACLALAAAGPHLSRALPPAVAVRALVPAAVVVAGATVFVLGTVTFTWLGQLGELAEWGTWSPRSLHLLDPIPWPAAALAGALLGLVGCWTAHTVLRIGRSLRAVRRALAAGSGDGSPFLVVDSPHIDAYTTPGRRGRVVVTSGALRALDPPQRRVLLAHEFSHRRHGHAWWTLVADLAAALNPALRPTAAGIRHAVERWADEDAARGGDRRHVAATIARVALLRAAPAPLPAAAGGHVPSRVQALLRPAPRLRARHLAAALSLTLAVLAGTLAVERTGETLFEHATPTATAAHR
jgi:hypothetical protein